MGNHIQDAVNHAVEKQHLQTGDHVDAQTAMHMMDDVFKELQKERAGLTKDKMPASYLIDAASKMEDALKQYGITDITFYDSGKGNKNTAGKGDTIKITEDTGIVFDTTKTYNLGERPPVTPQERQAEETKPAPIVKPHWKEQTPQYLKDPQKVKVEGYDN